MVSSHTENVIHFDCYDRTVVHRLGNPDVVIKKLRCELKGM